MRVLQIGADRSRRGILVPGSPAFKRQEAYAHELGVLDIVGFSLKRDGFSASSSTELRTHPTSSLSRLFFVPDAIRIATKLPWPDVVSAQDPFETGLVALIIARILKIPLHVQVHTDFLSPEYARVSLINRLRVMLAGFVLRRANRVRVVSAGIRDSIIKRYRITVPITILPIYVDARKYAALVPNDELTKRFAAFSTRILYIGRLEKEKNVRLAIEAFAQAAPADACLIIVGTGRERISLELLVRRLDAAGRIFFEGEQDAAAYLTLADLVLVTSHYEGYGLVIVEALAAGKPVLATDVGVAREAGAIISSPKGYAQALAAWCKDGPHRAMLRIPLHTDADAYFKDLARDTIAAL